MNNIIRIFNIIIVLLCIGSSGNAATDARLGGAFLTPQPYLGYTVNDWRAEFKQMKAIGMKTVIMRHTMDYCGGTSFYPTSVAGMTETSTADTDFENMMDAADAEEMDIHLGLVIDEKTWFKWAWVETETSYPEELVTTSTAVATELFTLYGTHPSLKGMYIPQEIDNANYRTQAALTILTERVLNPICNHIKSLRTNLIVSEAPFYNSVSSFAQPEEWQAIWTTILTACPNFDVVIVQDGIGARDNNTIEVIKEYFAATRAACDATGRQFWSDLELFVANATEYAPPPFDRVKQQLTVEAPYVDHFVCWVWQYCSPSYSPLAFEFNRSYLRYLDGQPPLVCETIGKTYTYNKTPHTSYPDNAMTKLTNGKWSPYYDSGEMVGWRPAGAEDLSITIDLGEEKSNLVDFRLNMIHDDAAGVPNPSAPSVAISTDGSNFTNIGVMTDNGSKSSHYANFNLATPTENVARYIRYSVPVVAWVIAVELGAYSTPPQTPVTLSTFQLQ